MKRLLYVLLSGLGTLSLSNTNAQTVYGNPSLNISALSPTVAVNGTANIQVQICNNGPSTVTIPASRLRPQLSTGSANIQIMGATDLLGNALSATDWTVQNLTSSNIRLLYLQPLAIGNCVNIYVVVKGITQSASATSPEAINGQLGFQSPVNGNQTGDDQSNTSIGVIQPPPLSVGLNSFTGSAAGCAAMLSWETATEQNNDYYELQYSADGRDFKAAGHEKSKNSATGAQYSYSYSGMVDGANYFRLKIVDLDGTFKYSPVVRVNGNCNTGHITVVPNPAHNLVTVGGLSSGMKLSFMDMAGREVKQAVAAGAVQQVSLGELANGVYMLRISDATGTVGTMRIVKN